MGLSLRLEGVYETRGDSHVTGPLGVGFALVAACTVGASVRKFVGALVATWFGYLALNPHDCVVFVVGSVFLVTIRMMVRICLLLACC
jgi:hypothetical protein